MAINTYIVYRKKIDLSTRQIVHDTSYIDYEIFISHHLKLQTNSEK